MIDKRKWVDSSGYFGPDRRRGGSKRWGDRRKLDESGQAPALGAMLRRLRVQMMDLGADRQLTYQMLSAAIRDAQRLRYLACADALQQADHALRTNSPNAAAIAEARIVEAMTHAGAHR
jgi:hypothetical protein